jgi:hypothetical protein
MTDPDSLAAEGDDALAASAEPCFSDIARELDRACDANEPQAFLAALAQARAFSADERNADWAPGALSRNFAMLLTTAANGRPETLEAFLGSISAFERDEALVAMPFRPPFWWAAASRCERCVRLLAPFVSNARATLDHEGKTPLHAAIFAFNGKNPALDALLEMPLAPLWLRTADRLGNTPIMEAILQGGRQAAERLTRAALDLLPAHEADALLLRVLRESVRARKLDAAGALAAKLNLADPSLGAPFADEIERACRSDQSLSFLGETLGALLPPTQARALVAEVGAEKLPRLAARLEQGEIQAAVFGAAALREESGSSLAVCGSGPQRAAPRRV